MVGGQSIPDSSLRERAVPCSKQTHGVEADQLGEQPTVETSVAVSRIPQIRAGVAVARCCSAGLLGWA